MARRTSRNRMRVPDHSFVAFLLVASFGILFAGCLGPEDVEDDSFTFTEDDVARYRELAAESGSGDVSSTPYLEPLESGSGRTVDADTVELDLSLVGTYNALRSGTENGKNVFQVSNDFLNIRKTPSTAGESVARLEFGDPVEVLSFDDATWAKVKVAGEIEGYAAHRYLSKVTSDEGLEKAKKEYENTFFVSFGFVNMRKEPNQQSEKIGEIPGATIVKPMKIEGGWAQVTHDGKEGFISTQYLDPFLPNFVVRQNTYELPVLQYALTTAQTEQLLKAMAEHVTALKAQGYSFITLRDFRDVLLNQQKRDVRLDPKKVVVAISGVTAANVKQVSDALNAAGINATLFIETRNVGLSGITEKRLLTLLANGFDIQSGGHSGDDLRSLTNAQVDLELKQSRKILEDVTKREIFAIGYPDGASNSRVNERASAAGYLLGVSDDAERSFTREQLLQIPGMTVFPTMTSDEVIEFVSGS